MIKIILVLIYFSTIISCFKLIYLKNLKSNKKLNSPLVYLENNLKSNHLISKRSLTNVNNIFEDNDQSKDSNTDYFDFTGLYKDEIKQKNLDRTVNRRRKINNPMKLKRRRRRRKRKHKTNRFKRKDDLDRLRRVSLKPSFNKFNLNNENQISPQKKLISLHVEDHFHHLIVGNKSLGDIFENNKNNLDDSINSKNPLNNLNIDQDNNHLNKILDNLVNGQSTIKPNIKQNNNKINDKNQAVTKKSNYLGNFHVVIRLPKDRDLSSLQNLTLVTNLNKEKELKIKLEKLQNSIDKLNNQMKPNNDLNQYLDNESIKSNSDNESIKNDLNSDNNSFKVDSNSLNNFNGNKFHNNFENKHMICHKRPPLMSTFCYMVN